MLRAESLCANSPLSRDLNRVGGMKMESVVGRNWWTSMLIAANTTVFGGMERRRDSLSVGERDKGMFRAERS